MRIRLYDERPKPFARTERAEGIVKKIARCRAVAEKAH
jgi:hypothetical protein